MTQDPSALDRGTLSDIIVYRIGCSREALADAEANMLEGRTRTAANRLYYAMYYAATALLIRKGFSAKSHHGAITLFNKELIKPGIIDISYGVLLSQCFSLRQAGDYMDFVIPTQEEILSLLPMVKKFVSLVEKKIE